MRVFIFAMVGFLVVSVPAQARVTFTLDSGYLYSRQDYHSSTSSFALLSDEGRHNRAQMSFGWRRLDLMLAYQYDQFDFTVSDLRRVEGLSTTASALAGGFRLHTRHFSLSYYVEKRDFFYLLERSTTDFALEKSNMDFQILSLKLFAWGSVYRLSMDTELGLPMSSASTDAGEVKYSHFSRGTVRLEFGINYRFGLFVGGGYDDYSIGAAEYNRWDFRGGVTLFIGSRPSKDKSDLSSDQMPRSARPGVGSPNSYPNY